MSRSRRRVPILLRLSALLLPADVREEVLGDLLEHWRKNVAGRRWTGRLRWLTRQPIAALSARLRFRVGRKATGSASPGHRWPPFSWLDVKLGVRMMGKHPAISVVIVFALALGIPASLAPHHVIDALFDESPPLHEGDEVLGILVVEGGAGDPSQLRTADYLMLRERLSSFETLGAALPQQMNVIPADGTAGGARGAYISASSFTLARVAPLLGRALSPADEVEGAPAVAVVGHDFWRSRLGGEPDVLGTTLRIGGEATTVVGVMPEGFAMPNTAQLWLPLRLPRAAEVDDPGPRLQVYGRLADGASQASAQAELSVMASRAVSTPERPTVRLQAVPFSALHFDEPRGRLGWILLAAAQTLPLIFLLVACGNVGILLLARTAARTEEVAIRTALGASRGRIVGQLFAEALLLALLATGVGLLGVDAIVSRLEARVTLPFWLDLGVTPELAVKALGLAVFSAVVAGVLPALRATGSELHRSLQGAGSGGRSLRFGPWVTALVVAEVALGVGALFAGGITLYAFRSNPDDATWAPQQDRYLLASISVPQPPRPVASPSGTGASAQPSAEVHRLRVMEMQAELGQRLRGEPGVRAWAFSERPPGEERDERLVRVEGDELPADHPGLVGVTTYVEPDFFEVLGVEPVGGRLFDGGDLPPDPTADPAAAIVNVKFLERRGMTAAGAVGRTMRFTRGPDEPPGPRMEIVGVVPNIEISAERVAFDGTPVVYLPSAPGALQSLTLTVDLRGDPSAFAPRLRALLTEADPTAILESVQPLEDYPNDGVIALRILTSVLGGLSLIAIVLSTAALYALMSLTVSQRTREIGIRVALGGEARRIAATVARRSLAQLTLGVILGAGFWIALLSATVEQSNGELARTIERWPLVLATAVAVVVAVGLMACLAPTWRALRTRPLEALSAEG